MLGRLLLISTILIGCAAVRPPAVAHAAAEPVCEVIDDQGICLIDATNPGRPGGPRDPRAGTPSQDEGVVDPCSYEALVPQPPVGDPLWAGRDPAQGALFRQVCLQPDNEPIGPATTVIFVPAGQDPRIVGASDPAVLALYAIEQMALERPPIEMAPGAESAFGATVGFPLWMWLRRGEATTGPISRTATAGPVSVTATARVSSVLWIMGDGRRVTCSGAGTPFDIGRAGRPSPSCGHVYTAPGTYPVTARATWSISWAGGGRSGTLALTLSSSVLLPVRQLRSLNVEPEVRPAWPR